MPHVIVEHSANMEPDLSPSRLVQEIDGTASLRTNDLHERLQRKAEPVGR